MKIQEIVFTYWIQICLNFVNNIFIFLSNSRYLSFKLQPTIQKSTAHVCYAYSVFSNTLILTELFKVVCRLCVRFTQHHTQFRREICCSKHYKELRLMINSYLCHHDDISNKYWLAQTKECIIATNNYKNNKN